jgi:hypothetical protein
MDAPLDKIVDHKDGNGLNNQKNNLRLCSYSQNSQNSKRPSHNTSGYKGACWSKGSNKWQAYIKLNGKCIHLGYFTCLLKAARAYDLKAKELFGNFARLNFPESK